MRVVLSGLVGAWAIQAVARLQRKSLHSRCSTLHVPHFRTISLSHYHYPLSHFSLPSVKPHRLGRDHLRHAIGRIQAGQQGRDDGHGQGLHEGCGVELELQGPAEAAAVDDVDQDQGQGQAGGHRQEAGYRAHQPGFIRDQPPELAAGQPDRT